MPCGDAKARANLRQYTIAPMHKSNYMLFTNADDLRSLNPKYIK